MADGYFSSVYGTGGERTIFKSILPFSWRFCELRKLALLRHGSSTETPARKWVLKLSREREMRNRFSFYISPHFVRIYDFPVSEAIDGGCYASK